MKNDFIKTMRSLWRLILAILAWLFAVVHLWSNRASCRLMRRLVDKSTLAAFDSLYKPGGVKTHQAPAANPIDYRQQLSDLLNDENEVIVGMVREQMEKTRAGLTVMQHVQDRHPYIVAYPTKQENIQRILNVLDLFPSGGLENAYSVLIRGIKNFHSTGEFRV